MASYLRLVSIKQRFTLIILLVGVGFLFILWNSYLSESRNLEEGKRETIRYVIESAHTVAEYYHKQSLAGALSEQEAKQQALAAIEHMRYNKGEYLWVFKRDFTIVMHPTKPSLNNTSSYNIKDKEGVYLFRKMVELITQQGEGFLTYFWQKPGVDKVAKKISYVKEFTPWQWILGTGVYMDDIEAELNQILIQRILATGAILVVLLTALYFIVQSITKPLHDTVMRMRDIASGKGDLTAKLDEYGRDEISALSVHFNVFVEHIRSLVSEVGGSVHTLAETSNGLLEAAESAVKNMQKQHMETEQVASAINEMSSTAHEIAGNASVASDSADEAKAESKNSRQIVQHTLVVVDSLANEMNTTTAAIEKLQQETENISNVLTVIQGIAEQTNLLALNAAIEAARAGEQGRGFSVVADEVRALARKTQESTLDIREMIGGLQSGAATAVTAMTHNLKQTRDTVMSAQNAEKALDVVDQAIGTMHAMNTQIAVASEEQSHVSEEINKNINVIAQLTEESQETSSRVVAFSDDVNRVGNSLKELVARFIV